MKRIAYLLFAGSVLLASCSREYEDPVRETVPEKPAFRMEVKADGTVTKTVIDEQDESHFNILWQAGDKLGVFEVGNGVIQTKAESDPLTAPGASATFGITLSGEAEAPYHYTFVYPASALSKKGDKYLVTIPSNQTFAPNSFDIDSDVLVSEHLAFPTERPTSVSPAFARLGGTVRLVIQAPTTTERIERISFSTTEANIVGSYYLDPTTGELTDDLKASFSKNIQLTPAASTTYSGNIVVWFRLAEVTLSDNFTVIVRTDAKTYTKAVDLASLGRSLIFQHGKLTKFGVNMADAVVTDNTYEGNYAEFTVQDVRGKGITTNNYKVIEPYLKIYGDSWTGKVNNDNGGFGIRRCDNGTNDSYLLLPKFKNGIASVTVTLSQAIAAGKTLFLSSTANGTEGDVASLTTVADQTVYTFDLTASDVSQAYLRVSGAAAYIMKVAVVGKNDSREALEEPANYSGTLDTRVNNLVHLEWDTVPDAAYYQINYTPEGGSTSSVLVEADETAQMQQDLDGLEYAKTYTFTITAIADEYFSKNSSAVNAAPLTTGAQPAGLTVDVIDVALTGVSTSSYTEWSGEKVNTAVYAGTTAKGSNAIQMNTSKHYGLYTTTSGGYLRSITITLTANTTNTVDVYAKNAAYASVDDLWNNQGTKIGSVSGNGSTVVKQKIILADNYTHFAVRSSGGAVYVAEIRVEWANAALPVASVITLGHDDVKATEATLNGSYSGAAGGIYEAGFYWDTKQSDLQALAHPDQVVTTDGSNNTSGNFTCKLGSLSELTTYYYKAYVLEFDSVSQTYVEHYGEIKSFTTLAKASFEPGGWLEMPSYTTAAMAGTTESALADLYAITHYATMHGDKARNYSFLYDPEVFASYWVAYPLCRDHLGTGREEDWDYDPIVPQAKQTAVFKGYGVNVPSAKYNNQHYARGHQLPNADRNGVDEMMAQTYYSTNMTPQLQHGFNGGVWANLEEAVRSVIKDNADTVYVVTGAAFRKKGGNETIQTITSTRDGKVLPVPNYYWKVLLKVKWSGKTVSSASTVGFWLEHRDNYDTGGTNYLPFVTTVDQIEEWTGFDFFSNLSSSLQTSAEANADWNAFKSY